MTSTASLARAPRSGPPDRFEPAGGRCTRRCRRPGPPGCSPGCDAVVWLAPVVVPFWAGAAVVVLGVVVATPSPPPHRGVVGVDPRPAGGTRARRCGRGAAGRSTNPVVGASRVDLADELAPGLGPQPRVAPDCGVPAGGARPRGRDARPHAARHVPRRRWSRCAGHGPARARPPGRRRGRCRARIEVHPGVPVACGGGAAGAAAALARARVCARSRARGGGTQFEALRDYVEGDDVRRVDWAATARAGHAGRPHLPRRAQPAGAGPASDAGRPECRAWSRTCRGSTTRWTPSLALATDRRPLGRPGRPARLRRRGRGRRAIPRRRGPAAASVVGAMHACDPSWPRVTTGSAFRDALCPASPVGARSCCSPNSAAEAVEEQLVPALPLLLRDHARPRRGRRGDPRARRLARPAAVRGPPSGPPAAAAAIRRVAARGRSAAPRRSARVVVDAAPGRARRPPSSTPTSTSRPRDAETGARRLARVHPVRPVPPRPAAERRRRSRRRTAAQTTAPRPDARPRRPAAPASRSPRAGRRRGTRRPGPSTITTARRPSSASAARRVRSPGASRAHPSCSPAPPATNTAVNSSSPCGRMQAPEPGRPPRRRGTGPRRRPTLTPLNSRTASVGSARGDAAAERQRPDPGVVGEHPGGERRPGFGRVVGLELLLEVGLAAPRGASPPRRPPASRSRARPPARRTPRRTRAVATTMAPRACQTAAGNVETPRRGNRAERARPGSRARPRQSAATDRVSRCARPASW